MADQLQDFRDSLLRIVKSFRPQSAADGNRIIGGKLFPAETVISQTLSHQTNQLFSDTLRTFFIKDSDPGADCPFNGRISYQVIFFNDTEQMQKCLRAACIHRLTDSLPRPFLKACRQQELSEYLVQFCVFAHDNTPYQFVADHQGISLSEKYVLHRLYRRLFLPIYLRRQHFCIAPSFCSGVIILLRIDPAG